MKKMSSLLQNSLPLLLGRGNNVNRPIHRGFTLIELLLAMAIFSIVSLTGFTLFNTVLTGDESLRTKNERLNELNRAFLVIERDVVQLSRRTIRVNGESPLKGFLHNDSDGIFSETTSVAFVRAGWTNPDLMLPRSDLQPIVYQLNEEKLERLHFNFVDSVVGEEPMARTLIEGVEALSFEFFSQGKWQKELNSDELPQALAFVITTKDFGEIRRQFLLPAVPVTKDNADEDT